MHRGKMTLFSEIQFNCCRAIDVISAENSCLSVCLHFPLCLVDDTKFQGSSRDRLFFQTFGCNSISVHICASISRQGFGSRTLLSKDDVVSLRYWSQGCTGYSPECCITVAVLQRVVFTSIWADIMLRDVCHHQNCYCSMTNQVSKLMVNFIRGTLILTSSDSHSEYLF